MSATSSTVSARAQAASAPLTVAGPVVLLGRLLFTLLFVMAGPQQFTSQLIGYAAAQGVPLPSIAVPVAGVLAIAGGLSVLLGYRAKIGAWLLVVFLAGVTPLMHNFWAVSDPVMHQTQFVNFMKNLSMLGAALFITQTGSGPWSLDARRK